MGKWKSKRSQAVDEELRRLDDLLHKLTRLVGREAGVSWGEPYPATGIQGRLDRLEAHAKHPVLHPAVKRADALRKQSEELREKAREIDG